MPNYYRLRDIFLDHRFFEGDSSLRQGDDFDKDDRRKTGMSSSYRAVVKYWRQEGS